ncbi:MAG: DUF1573 domain-containing protein [Cyclobacteriaceae bacterium]|nr:DUF1573 domain-containing protein [Cyclobacteriaceae bacterium]
MRKIGYFIAMMAVTSVMMLSNCSSKESEKRIAELENRLKELENPAANNPSAPVQTAQPEEKPEGPLPAFQFETTEHDFGTINQGDVVEYTFKFTNTGEAPLIIQSAVGSCGCTVPSWPKEPIPVGGSSEVTAKFDSKGKAGTQNKTITITANTWPKKTTLLVKSQVLASTDAASGPVKN